MGRMQEEVDPAAMVCLPSICSASGFLSLLRLVKVVVKWDIAKSEETGCGLGCLHKDKGI